MNVIHILCSSISAHIFCMLKNVSVFPRVNVDAIITSDQRQSNVSISGEHALNSLFSFTEVCPSHTYTAHGPGMKK